MGLEGVRGHVRVVAPQALSERGAHSKVEAYSVLDFRFGPENEAALAVVRGGRWGGLRGNGMGLFCVEVWGLSNLTQHREQTHD